MVRGGPEVRHEGFTRGFHQRVPPEGSTRGFHQRVPRGSARAKLIIPMRKDETKRSPRQRVWQQHGYRGRESSSMPGSSWSTHDQAAHKSMLSRLTERARPLPLKQQALPDDSAQFPMLSKPGMRELQHPQRKALHHEPVLPPELAMSSYQREISVCSSPLEKPNFFQVVMKIAFKPIGEYKAYS